MIKIYSMKKLNRPVSTYIEKQHCLYTLNLIFQIYLLHCIFMNVLLACTSVCCMHPGMGVMEGYEPPCGSSVRTNSLNHGATSPASFCSFYLEDQVVGFRVALS